MASYYFKWRRNFCSTKIIVYAVLTSKQHNSYQNNKIPKFRVIYEDLIHTGNDQNSYEIELHIHENACQIMFSLQRSCLIRAHENYKLARLWAESHWSELRANVSLNQTNSGKFVSPPTFIFCNPICSNDCGVVFFVKIYFSFREIIFFARLPLASITTGE